MSKIRIKSFEKQNELESRKNFPFIKVSLKAKHDSILDNQLRRRWLLFNKCNKCFYGHKQIDTPILTRYRGNTAINGKNPTLKW